MRNCLTFNKLCRYSAIPQHLLHQFLLPTSFLARNTRQAFSVRFLQIPAPRVHPSAPLTPFTAVFGVKGTSAGTLNVGCGQGVRGFRGLPREFCFSTLGPCGPRPPAALRLRAHPSTCEGAYGSETELPSPAPTLLTVCQHYSSTLGNQRKASCHGKGRKSGRSGWRGVRLPQNGTKAWQRRAGGRPVATEKGKSVVKDCGRKAAGKGLPSHFRF